MGRHKLIKDEPQEEVLEVTFNDGDVPAVEEAVKDEPQEEVLEVTFNDGDVPAVEEAVKDEPQEEKQPVSFKGTGRFECKLSLNGKYFVVSPEGKLVTPMNLSEDKAKELVFRFNK